MKFGKVLIGFSRVFWVMLVTFGDWVEEVEAQTTT